MSWRCGPREACRPISRRSAWARRWRARSRPARHFWDMTFAGHGAIVASLNVLVTAASRRVPLIRAFQDALKAPGIRGRVIVTDVNPLSPAVHAAERWYHVP